MSGANHLRAEALILGSGPLNPEAETVIRAALAPFVHEIKQIQRIDLAGRTIIAVLIALDSVHLAAIAADLEKTGLAAGLDIAIELQ